MRSQKPDTGIASLYGFGCADSGPDSGSSRYRGLIHTFIVRDPFTYVKDKQLDYVIGSCI
jgi:hypothetical protein